MMILSYVIGQKYFPVNYNIGKFCGYLGLSVALYVVSILLKPEVAILRIGFATVLLLIFLGVVYKVEKPKIAFIN
jgi:hypothetical protein